VASHEAQVHNDAFVDSGPVQVGNYIDVNLQPLIDDLLVVWEKDGIRMWDEFQEQHFNLRAMLFITIQDGPALGSISRQAFKGYNVSRMVNMTTLKVHFKKSHDCHILIRQFLPIAIRDILPVKV
jgi:hypothetical protein